MEDSPENEDQSAFVVVVKGSLDRLLQNPRDYHIEYLLAVPPRHLQPFIDDRRTSGDICLVSPDVSAAMHTAVHIVKKEDPTVEARIPSPLSAHQDTNQMTSEDELEELLNYEHETTPTDERDFPGYIWPTSHQGGPKRRNSKGKGKRRANSKSAASNKSKGKQRACDESVPAPMRTSRGRARYNPLQTSQGCRRSKRLESPEPLPRRSARLIQNAIPPVASSSRRQLTPPSHPVASSSRRQLTPLPSHVSTASSASSSSSHSPSPSSSSSQSRSPSPPCPFDFDDYKEAVNLLMGPRRPTSPVFEAAVRDQMEQARKNDAVQVLDNYKDMWTDYFAAKGIVII